MWHNSSPLPLFGSTARRVFQRRLVFQQLEPRLTLSASFGQLEYTFTQESATPGGGFVDVARPVFSVAEASQFFGLKLGSHSYEDTNSIPVELSDTPIDGTHQSLVRSLDNGVVRASNQGGRSNQIQTIELPEFPSLGPNPTGGTIAVPTMGPFSNSPFVGPIPEFPNMGHQLGSLASASSPENVPSQLLASVSFSGDLEREFELNERALSRDQNATSQRGETTWIPSPSTARHSSEKLTPSRGREIQFRVATVTPPNSVLVVPQEQTSPQARILGSNHVSNESGSSTASGLSLSSSWNQKSPGIISNSRLRGPLPFARSFFDLRKDILQPRATDMRESVSEEEDTTSPERASPRDVSAVRGTSEEHARDAAFSDWKGRGAFAIPLLAVLASGPVLYQRRRREFSSVTGQVSPQRSAQRTDM